MIQTTFLHQTALGSPPAPPSRKGTRMGNDGERRRKYIFAAQLDDRIREIYLCCPGAKTRPSIKQLSERVGIPHWTLKKRARELGLARTKEKPWAKPNSPSLNGARG